MANILLAWGADPAIKDIDGKTAYDIAEEKSYKKIAMLLSQETQQLPKSRDKTQKKWEMCFWPFC